MHFLSRFGDSSVNGWQVIVRTSSKWGKIRLSRSIWPWSSRSITPQNNRHLNQGVLHLCFKFGDFSLNGWWVIVRTSKWLIHTHTYTHTLTDTHTGAMTIPEGQNWPWVKTGIPIRLDKIWWYKKHLISGTINKNKVHEQTNITNKLNNPYTLGNSNSNRKKTC